MSNRNLTDLIAATRTYRRFFQQKSIPDSTLLELIELARLSGSAMNLQPLKYMLINEPQKNRRVFTHLGWAGYLAEWPGPEEGERPSAYIICLLDTNLSKNGDIDLGIASQNIMLGATAKGLGGCRIGSVSPSLHQELKLAGHLKILLVLALGVPREEVKIDELGQDGDIKYWRDQRGIHHVPKRGLDNILVSDKL